MEHMGERNCGHLEDLSETDGLVEFLDSSADRESCRLRRHTVDTVLVAREQRKEQDLPAFPLDPEHPVVEENVFEVLSRNPSGFFSKGIVYLNAWLMESTGQDVKKRHDALPGRILQLIYSHWIFFSIILLILILMAFWLSYK